MKIFLRVLFGIILVHFAIEAQAQCNGVPNINGTSGTSVNVGTTTATLGGDVTDDGNGNCSLTIGVLWSTTSGSGYTDVIDVGNTSTGPFTVDVNGLPSGTRIYYKAYVTNSQGTDYTNERSFYTLAAEPAVHAASLTATATDNESILLQFPAASTITDAAGYIILGNINSDPGTGTLNDGSAPAGSNFAIVSDPSATSYAVPGLDPNTNYHFIVIPYNRESDDATYNYLTSSGYPTANATTEPDVDVDANGNGVTASGTLNDGSTDHGIMGFTLESTGPVIFENVVIHMSSTGSGQFTNFRLFESTNNDNLNVDFDNELTSGVTINVTTTDITITLTESLVASTPRYFFLVADVDPLVNNLTPSVQFSYDETDFTFSPNNISGTGNQSRTYDFVDATPPSLTSTAPADDAPGVDFNLDKLTLTFNEDVDNITTAASADAHRVIIYRASDDVAVLTVDREDVIANVSPTVEITIPPSTLEPNTDYYVLIGNAVIEDVPGDNDWAGISDPTVWNFSTSGVIINPVTSNICSGSFQAIADIVISEEAVGDFITDGIINLDFSDADFGYDITSATVSAGPAGNTDITTIKLDPKTLTRLTLDYKLDGTNDKVDVITISGLKVYASAPGSTTIVTSTNTAGIWAIDPSIVFATINVGTTTPAAPVLEASQDLLFCANEDISAATVAVVNGAGTFNWYDNASLSTLKATGDEVNVTTLGINSSVVGTVKRYVVHVDGCQSAPLEVTFEVAPIPLADAGPATVEVCSGTSVTLGGAPTLIGPSVSGTYQYLWSTNASLGGFTDMGPNPMVTPTYGKDTTFTYTVKIIDANGCTSDIDDLNAKIAVQVDSTDEVIVYNSPLSTSFTLNSDPIELSATPSNGSSYSGNGVYLSEGTYYFDPDLAGTAGSPHDITYTTQLSNGCPTTEVRKFAVSNASGSIINLAGSYCENEGSDPSKKLALGPVWQSQLDSDNATYYEPNGYRYDFYDFQEYKSNGTAGLGVEGTPSNQYIVPGDLQPYVSGANYTYIGMRVRRYVYPVLGPLGIVLTPGGYDPDTLFWRFQYVNLYTMPALKVSGIKPNQIICDVNETYNLEANFNEGYYEISRDSVTWFTGPGFGIADTPPNSGKATFNPHDAYTSNGFGVPPGPGKFFIRYTYNVPGTVGSNSSACAAALTTVIFISSNPGVSWVPLTETEFCYEAASITVETNSASPTQVAINGYGIFDQGNGTAAFDPDEALKAKAFGTNSPPYTNYNAPEDIVISATRTDINGCKTTIQQTVKVRPLFPASFTESDLDVCYEDGPQDIVGDQPNGFYDLFNPNLSMTFPTSTINDFNLRTLFDNAVANGADGSVSQKFKLTFNTEDPTLHCKNSVSKTFNVNPRIPMDIGGMTPGMIVCGNGAPFDLTGNQPSAGSFEISTSETSGFVNNALGLNNTTSGKATFTPAGAGIPAGDPQKSLYIRYSFLGAGCTGTAQITEELIINPQPDVTFASTIPAAGTPYCFEQGTSPTTVVLSTDQSSNVAISGFGITDNGGGSAIFNPTSAYQQSSLAENFNPQTDQTIRNIVVTATRTDALSCANTTTVTYTVNPLPTASFTPAQVEFCYEDDPVTLQGPQTNVKYQFIYRNTTSPANYSPAPVYQPTVAFDPEAIFTDAVAKGANPLATLQFDVIYTAISSSTGCTNQLAPVTLNVSPRIPVAISGIEDGEIFCSNVTDRVLEFSPPGGTFRINGATEPFSNNQYVFNPPIEGPANGTGYTFSYTLITGNNCTNTLEKIVKVLPSPKALFTVQPQCDTALVSYHAQGTGNLAASSYTWNFSGEIKTGQDVEHRFPGVSTYYAKLKVEHPPFEIAPGEYLVCSDSLQLDQVVGPYPRDIRFEYFNVCEDDETNFEVSSSVPINRVAWDFGDGESTSYGILSENITGLTKTNGTYQNPIHRFGSASSALTVKVVGKTADNFGGCPSVFERNISILKRWEPAAGELYYDMAQLDNGRGFWMVEDEEGNSTWEFDAPSKARINTSEPAWVTGATEPYNANDVSYVNSPCFDLSAFSRPVISIKHWADTEPSDGAVLQYSVDGGDTWERLGDVASGLDWYNRLTISSNPGEQTDLSSGWSLTNQLDWAVGKHTLDVLPQARSQVRFRVAFASFNNREHRDGFAFNNVVIEERNRTILAENFTTLNPAQEANNTEFKKFRADANYNFNHAELVKLQYHHTPAQNSLPPDPLNLENPTDQNARAAFYGVTTSARAFIDGGFGQSSSNATFLSPDLSLYFSLRSLVTSPVTIAVDFEPEPADKLNVKATVAATTDLSGTGQYNVFIAVVEKEVMDQVYVLRKFLPTAAGTALTALSPLDPAQEIHVSYDMRHVTRDENGDYKPFAVIVFVQNLQTKDVLQTTMRDDGTASSEIVTGVEIPFDHYLQVYPNPANDRLNITLPLPATSETPLKIFDTFGKEVNTTSFKTGEAVKSIDTKSLSTGVYLLELTLPEGRIRKKVMVVHE